MSNTHDREISRDEWRARSGGKKAIVLPKAESFPDEIEREFVVGSAIALDVYRDAIEIIEDTGKWEPNYALNQRVSRSWQTKSAHRYGAIAMFKNEDGTSWQGKAQNPKHDAKKGKDRKYETPEGNGSQAYLPKVNLRIRRRVARRYGITDPTFVPTRASRKRGIKMVPFWDWIAAHPEIHVIITEGGKKALCLLSLGVVAIALYGVNGGYRVKDALDNPIPPELIADVARFAAAGRRVNLAFDQDSDLGTRCRVAVALGRFGGLLERSGCEVSIATWDSKLGKGIDDLVVGAGVVAAESAIDEAMPFSDWAIWQRLEGRLQTSPRLRLNTNDLSTSALDGISDQGIIAIASAKGSGKTKLLSKVVADSPKVLSAGHRIALQRNLCDRLKLNYIGDVDKVQGKFISESAYTLRIGFCVDSLMAIDPHKFEGCDLVIDEAVQVLRHLLTSKTCAKDGKRPVLLARLTALIRAARRVLVADADLDDAVLHYLAELRGDGSKPFLLLNDYQSDGYPVEFVNCTDNSAAIDKLIDDAGVSLAEGKVLFVATDNKKLSIHLAQVLRDLGLRVLLINSATSSGQIEREFITTPDLVLARREYDAVVSTPSMATGVSIESQGIIHSVYGIFSGVSSTDADMSQSLGRVREPVPRVVWCAKRGSSFSRVSRSTNPLELKSHLRDATATTISLIRSSLKADVTGDIPAYDWQSDPHLNLWAKIEADRNRSMMALRDNLRVRLQHEGNQVTVIDADKNEAVRQLLTNIRDRQKITDAESIVSAEILTVAEALKLENKESISPEQQRSLDRFYLCDFYGWNPAELTKEQVLSDKGGRRRGELLNLEAQLYPHLAVDRAAKSLEKQTRWNQGLCPWDISGAAVRSKLREKLGLNAFLDGDRTWTKYDVEASAALIRQHASLVKQVLSFTVNDEISDVQLVHQLLSQLGMKAESKYCRSVPGHEGEKLKVYRLDSQRWQESTEILDRRRQQRGELAAESKADLEKPPTQIETEPIRSALCLDAVDGSVESAVMDGFEVGDRVRIVIPDGTDDRTRKEMIRCKEAPFGAIGTIKRIDSLRTPGSLSFLPPKPNAWVEFDDSSIDSTYMPRAYMEIAGMEEEAA